MISRKSILLLLVLAISMLVVQGAFAQTTSATSDPATAEDPTLLLTRLSVQFNVELATLQNLFVAGYTSGEIRLALEISVAANKTLEEAIIVAAGTDGHGWGVLAQALGMAPGSAEFHALKEELGSGRGTMGQEQAGDGKGNGKKGGKN
jgi:hypothetical protein